MRKNVLISLMVAGALILGSVTVLAGNMIAKKVECPNCGAEVEVQVESREKKDFGNRGFRKGFEVKAIEELKTELDTKVAAGEMTQEQADKHIANYEKMKASAEERKAKAEERKEEAAKKLEEYKAELSAKVASGEITQEEMDKQLAEFGKKRPQGRRGGFRAKTAQEYKAELSEKVSAGEMTQEEMDKLVAEYETQIKKFSEKAPGKGNFRGRGNAFGRGRRAGHNNKKAN